MRANFARDEDISSEETVVDALRELALPAMAIVAACQSEASKPRLRAQTERAMALGIFGAPTFFVDDQIFWGNDRLDDAIALASRTQLPATAGA